jgi:hypothetical protein
MRPNAYAFFATTGVSMGLRLTYEDDNGAVEC